MQRACTVCQHDQVQTIEGALIAGVTQRTIARRFGVSRGALYRHKQDGRVRARLERAREEREAAQADALLAQVRALQERTLRLLEQADADGSLGAAVRALREARGNLALLAKLLGGVGERPRVNLAQSAEWLEVRGAVLAALVPYPEARLAVAERLRALGAG